jgi:hypothetical protein
MASAKRKSRGQWIDDVWDGVGKYVRLETTHGVNRSGKLSGIRTRKVNVNGEDVDIPIELEVNGDPTDTIPIHLIVKLSIDA